MNGLLIWAQAASSATTTATAKTPTGSLVSVAIHRWFGSGTLSPSTASPNFDALGITLGGLSVIFVLVGMRQGFLRAFGQLLDVPGHLKLFKAATGRLKKASRIVAVAIGATVLVWTGSQMLTYSEAKGRDDLLLLTKSRGPGELAVEHAVLASVIPWRDIFSLGDYIPLAILAAAIIFQAANQAAANPYILARSEKPTLSIWATFAWGSAALYALYRIVGLIAGSGDLPLGGCAIPIEAPIVPILMVMTDGLLLAWVLVELRNASLGDVGNEVIDADGVVQLFPVAIFACLLAMPGRYLCTFAWLLLEPFQYYLPGSTITSLLRLQVGPGVLYEQRVAFMTVGLVGAAAWTRGSPWAALLGYWDILKEEGGRLVAVLGVGAVVAGLGTGIAYSIMLAHPAQTWVLAAADSYAHYVTLPIGLIMVAAFVELGERTLPSANLADKSIVQDPTVA